MQYASASFIEQTGRSHQHSHQQQVGWVLASQLALSGYSANIAGDQAHIAGWTCRLPARMLQRHADNVSS